MSGSLFIAQPSYGLPINLYIRNYGHITVLDFFGLEPVDRLPIEYLDGLALYREDGRLKLESHHGSVSEIDLPSYLLK